MIDFYKERYGDRFDAVPVVSREQSQGALHGRITTCIANGSLEATVDRSFTPDCCVMMCGNPDMLTETETLLGERGIKRHKPKEPGQIVLERYW